MKIVSRFALVAAVMVAMPAAAQTDFRGFYLSGFGAYNIMNGQESTPYFGTTPLGSTSEIEYDQGFAFGGAAGYSFGNGFRTELEYATRSNDVENVDPQASGTFVSGGTVDLQTIMANFVYDLPVEIAGFARPYFGLGMGYGMASYDQIRDLGGFTIDDDGNGLAYQMFGGLALGLTDRLSTNLEYRYVATDEFELDTRTVNVQSDLNYGSHNILLGMRYMFGDPVSRAPEPMPAAAPAPMPAPMAAPVPQVQAPMPMPAPAARPAPVVPQTYIVFFDFDKSNLTPEAQRVLQRAAQDVRVGQGARIQVIGHADRSGSNRYNQRLSERRAAVVQNELERLGVPAEQISKRALGETQNRVQTADGVREAQNRRAEIVFQ